MDGGSVAASAAPAALAPARSARVCDAGVDIARMSNNRTRSLRAASWKAARTIVVGIIRRSAVVIDHPRVSVANGVDVAPRAAATRARLRALGRAAPLGGSHRGRRRKRRELGSAGAAAWDHAQADFRRAGTAAGNGLMHLPIAVRRVEGVGGDGRREEGKRRGNRAGRCPRQGWHTVAGGHAAQPLRWWPHLTGPMYVHTGVHTPTPSVASPGCRCSSATDQRASRRPG
eukprot:350093-Chlamydomonas_euryale.AAC.6